MPRVILEHKALLVLKVLKAQKVILEHKVLRVLKALLAPKETLVPMALLVKVVTKGKKAKMVLPVQREPLVLKAPLALRVLKEI